MQRKEMKRTGLTNLSGLPESVLRKGLLLLDSRGGLPLGRGNEEQTGRFVWLEEMAQIASVRRITVVFDVPSVGRVWQAVLVAQALHDLGFDDRPVTHAQGLVKELVPALLRPCHRQEWMRLSPQNPLDGGAGVEPRRH